MTIFRGIPFMTLHGISIMKAESVCNEELQQEDPAQGQTCRSLRTITKNRR
jgi:hypothetical protein